MGGEYGRVESGPKLDGSYGGTLGGVGYGERRYRLGGVRLALGCNSLWDRSGSARHIF